MDPEPAAWLPVLFFIFFSFVLVALNAFFVASEFAIVKVRRTRLEELAGQGVAAARAGIQCVEKLDEYLSATQLGITLVSLGLGWIGEEAFFKLFTLLFPDLLSGQETLFHSLAAVVAFFIITMLHVVLGELVPKSMAIQQSEQIVLLIARPLHLFYQLARPLIMAFTAIANFVLRRIGYHGLEEAPISENELRMIMRESREDGIISDSEAQIISKAFSFSDRRASDIMVPAARVDYLSLGRSFEDNMAVTRTRMFTRYPLVQTDLSTIHGIVHLKDVAQQFLEHQHNAAFELVVRPAVFVTPGMPQDAIMKLMKEKRTQLVVVKDSRSGKILGIVTMEDILEQLVGEIIDEHGN